MRKFLLALGFSALALTSLSSCDLDSLIEGDEFTQCLGINSGMDILSGLVNTSMDAQNCPRFESQYQQTIAEEGRLLTLEEVKGMVDRDADFAMALSLNATGIKKLFESSVSWAKDFPVIIDVGGCRDYGNQSRNCLAFGFRINGYDVTFGVPITSTIKRDGQDGGVGDRTSVFADLSKAQIIHLTGNSLLDIGLETVILQVFKPYMKEYHMFDIAAWNIGNGDVKLFAGAPKVQVDNATGYKALEFGMYSNLYHSQHDAVNFARSMPQDAEVGLHIHPDLIRNIIGRMMTEVNAGTGETYVTRSVVVGEDAVGVGATGSFHVSMTDMTKYPQALLSSCSSEWRDFLTFGFRLWSTESFCGYMDLLAGLKISLDQNRFNIALGNIHGGYSDGAMSLTNGIFNAFTTSDFFKQMMSYVNFSINFNELTVSDLSSENKMRKASMNGSTFRFDIDGSGISLYLNFVDL